MLISEHLPSCWQGRIDPIQPSSEEADPSASSLRLHQTVEYQSLPQDFQQAAVLLGMPCDIGVRLNQGRVGAAEGPDVIRRTMANLCVDHRKIYDVGDVRISDAGLSQWQQATADSITDILRRNGRPVLLGGGHEIAWASYSGAQQYLEQVNPNHKLGILNFDAHFDLRDPNPITSSGTPFRQMAENCRTTERNFKYLVIGINRLANTSVLFDYARQNQVQWIEDQDCQWPDFQSVCDTISDWISTIDALYLSLDLDVFSSAFAPGVSAPAALGLEPGVVLRLVKAILDEVKDQRKRILVADVAEMNPRYDVDSRTARLAARYVGQLLTHE